MAARKIGDVILAVQNISLSFGGVKALTDISFDVREHEVRAIIGPNGAGKSSMALKYADYGYILESGRIVMDGPARELADNEDVKEFYLGVGGGERKSFRAVKSYKRRKRWLA